VRPMVLEVICSGWCWGKHCNHEQNRRDDRKLEVTMHDSPPLIPLELYCRSSGRVQYYFSMTGISFPYG
jgi:hypothetical protein